MIPLLDYSAIEEMRKRLAGVPGQPPQGLLSQGQPPAGEPQPPQIQPMAQAPIQAPPQPQPALLQPPPDQMAQVPEGGPIRNDLPNIGLLDRPNLLSRAASRVNDIGKPRLSPGMRSLLSADEADKAESGGGLLGRLAAQAISLGMWTPGIQAQMRAEGMLADKDALAQRAAMRQLMAKYRTGSSDSPEKALENAKGFLADAMTQGLVPANTWANAVDALKAPTEKSYEPDLFVDEQGNAQWVNPGQKIPVGWKKYAAPTSTGTPQLFRLKNGKYAFIKPNEDVPAGAVPAQTERTNITVAGANERASNSATSKLRTDFQRAIKTQTDRAPIIEQALVTLRDAADETDPAKQRTLYSSAIANFVQAADQKAQLRYQLLNFFKTNVDPSIGGKWEVLKQRLTDGRLPQYTLRSMIAHLSNLKKMTGDEINRQRTAWVGRHPELNAELPDANEFFASGFDEAIPDGPSSKTMSRATFNKLSPSEQKDALAAGYVVK